jgi:hypothetical protein
MPPRISSNRGVPRRGHSSRGDHPGGANRGSRLGGPSSINIATPLDASDSPSTPFIDDVTNNETIPSQIPAQVPAPIATNHPTAFRGQPSGNRGRGAGRGDAPDRGQLAARNRGRGRGRGAGRGGAPDTSSGLETTPAASISGESASSPLDPHGATRGQPFRGRGGFRGNPSARGGSFDSQGPFRGRSSRGRGGAGGGFIAGSSDTTGSPSGIPG